MLRRSGRFAIQFFVLGAGLCTSVALADSRRMSSACQIAASSEAVAVLQVKSIGEWSKLYFPGYVNPFEATAVQAEVSEVLKGSIDPGPLEIYLEGFIAKDGSGSAEGPLRLDGTPVVVFLVQRGGKWLLSSQGLFDSLGQGKFANAWFYRKG
jgi:hypothetical protein